MRKFEKGAQLKVDGKVDPSEAKAIKAAATRGAEGGPDGNDDANGTSNGGASAGDPGTTDPGTGDGTAPAPATGKVTISDDGTTATAPADAPQEVKDAVAAANKITDTPYKYGGGHGSFNDDGYDCSGAVSYALHGADLIDAAGGLDRTGVLGRVRQGHVDHGLREVKPRVHHHRRRTLRHLGCGRRRPALAQGRGADRRLRRAPSRRALSGRIGRARNNARPMLQLDVAPA